ncbi:MAG: hypothetical protein JNL70_06555 [Saprospiraceae bacterium]|nr:hypothetical protein [Saprospiraceae bacterium]
MLETKQLEEKLNNIDESVKSNIMSTYDNIVMLGYEKGVEQEKERKNKQFIFNALQKGLPLAVIAELVELPIDEVAKIIESFDNV